MGKIITGTELVEQFVDTIRNSKTFNSSFDRSNLITAINNNLKIDCENSGKCIAFTSTDPNGLTVSTYDFAYALLESDTAFEVVGNSTTSFYLPADIHEANKLIDEDSLYPMTNLMMINNFTWTNGVNVESVLTGSNPTGCSLGIDVSIRYNGTVTTWLTNDSGLSVSQTNSAKLKRTQTDVLLTTQSITTGLTETTSIGVLFTLTYEHNEMRKRNISNGSLSITTTEGNYTFSTSNYSSNVDYTTIEFSGSMTIKALEGLTSLSASGTWDTPVAADVVSTININSCYLQTSANNGTTTGYLPIQDAIIVSSVSTPDATLLDANFMAIAAPFYISNSKNLIDGELEIQMPGQYVGTYTGNYYMRIQFRYDSGSSQMDYTLYFQISISSAGVISMQSSVCFLDLSSMNAPLSYKVVANMRTNGEVIIRNVISSNITSQSITAGSTTTTVAPLCNYIYFTSSLSNSQVKVQYMGITYIVKQSGSGTYVNLIPATGGTILNFLSNLCTKTNFVVTFYNV